MSVALARQAPYPTRVQQRRCSKCGKLVSRSAYACRRCGKSQRTRPRTILLCLAGGLMAGMFAVASAGSLLPPAHPAEGSMSVKMPTDLHREVTVPRHTPEVSATDLWMSYSRDAVGADRLYREQSVVVNGTIRSVDRNYEGEMVVRLGTGDAFETVNATLATRNDPVLGTTLTKGHPVSLLCVGHGALLGAPILGSCFVR